MNEEHFSMHLQYKHSGTFTNRKYEELSYPKKSENVRPHYSQSSLKNTTPLQKPRGWFIQLQVGQFRVSSAIERFRVNEVLDPIF